MALPLAARCGATISVVPLGDGPHVKGLWPPPSTPANLDIGTPVSP